ncbi:MAG: hypothetical protein ACXIUV_02905 [Alkalilacustris sp.]
MIPSHPLRRLAAVLALLALPVAAGAQVADRPAWLLGYGPDFGESGGGKWRAVQLTAEVRSANRLVGPLRPIYSFSVSRRGGVMGGVGVHGVIPLGGLGITPHFSLGLWQDGRGGFEARELIQFRSGIDLFVPVSARARVGLGYYHVSNAGITRRSADQDVIRLAVLWTY